LEEEDRGNLGAIAAADKNMEQRLSEDRRDTAAEVEEKLREEGLRE
jgi:hypothetical protein